MIYNIKKFIIENEIIDLVQDDLKNQLVDSKLLGEKLKVKPLTESIIATKQKMFKQGIPPTSAANKAIQDIKEVTASGAKQAAGLAPGNRAETPRFKIPGTKIKEDSYYNKSIISKDGTTRSLKPGNKILRKNTLGPNGNRLTIANGKDSRRFKGVSDATAKQEGSR